MPTYSQDHLRTPGLKQTYHAALVNDTLSFVEVENSFSLLHVKAGAIHLKDRNQATGVKLFVPGSSFHIERMIALKARPYKASDHIKLGAREALQIFDIFFHHMRGPQHLK